MTHGCIRLYPDDVAALFALIRVGTPVRLIDDAVKVAWVDGELLLEAHPPVDAQGQSFEPDVDQFSELLRAAVGDRTVAIHWDYAREVLQKADGVIATVGLEADASALDMDSGGTKDALPDAAAAADQPAAQPSAAAQPGAAAQPAIAAQSAAAAQSDAPARH